MALYRCSVNAGGGGGMPTPLEYEDVCTTGGTAQTVKPMDTSKHRYIVIRIVNNNTGVEYAKTTFVTEISSAANQTLINSSGVNIAAQIITGNLIVRYFTIPAGGIKIYFKEYDMDDFVNNL